MENSYELTYDLTSLAEEIGKALKEKHSSTVMVDSTGFASEASNCRIDTYQVFELNRRGHITINVYFFRPELVKDNIQVKFSLFSPLWNQSSLKIRRLQKEIDSIIRSHIGNAQ